MLPRLKKCRVLKILILSLYRITQMNYISFYRIKILIFNIISDILGSPHVTPLSFPSIHTYIHTYIYIYIYIILLRNNN